MGIYSVNSASIDNLTISSSLIVSGTFVTTENILGTSSYASTASYILGSNVDGNITGNASNITSYTINQNLSTTNQVTFTGVTASLQGTSSWAENVVSASYALTSSFATTAQTLLGSVVSASYASTASYVITSNTSSYVDYNNIANKPSLVSGSAQISYIGITDVPANILSSSAQIATEISGAFTSDSASFSTRITTNETNISNLQTDSGSFSTRITTNETNISNLQTDSGSFSTRVTTLETDNTTQDSRLNSIESVTGSYATTGSNNFNGNQQITGSLIVSSSNVDFTLSAGVSGSFSGSFTGDGSNLTGISEPSSASFSARITTNETNIANLQTDSGSFSTRITTNETDISNLQTDSGSFSTRVTTNETNISNLQTDSGSFSTRVTTLETDNTTQNSRLNSIESVTGSYATTGSNNFNGNQVITGSLTVSSSVVDFTNTTAISGSTFSGSFVGDGSGLVGVVSSSYAVTSSYASTAQTLLGSVVSASYASTASYVITSNTSSYILGSNVDGNIAGNAANITDYSINQNLSTTSQVSFTGLTASLEGTSSWANNVVSASYSVTSSYANTAQTLLGSVVSASYASTASYVITSNTASYVLGSGVDGNITGNASNITAFTIDQNLSTTSQVSFSGVTASLQGTSSWAENVTSASYSTTSSYALTAQTLLGSVETANTASYILGSGVDGNITGNAANITAFTIDQNLSTTSQTTFGGITSSLNGTSSWAENASSVVSASYSTTSSYALTAQTLLGSVTSASYASTASYVITANTASYVLGSNVDGNIAGNAANITAFSIDQNLSTTSQVTFAGITASLEGTSSWASNSISASYAPTIIPLGISSGSKSITVESPTNTEDIAMFFMDRAITVTKMAAVVRGTTPSITWTVRHGTDRSATGAEVVTGGTTTTNTTSGDIVTSFNDATIVTNSFIWLESTATSGTVDEFNLTLFYTFD